MSALWKQTAEQLAERIQRGDYLPGQALPTSQELAAELGIARVTLSRALGVLKSRGLVTGDGRRGMWVCERIVFTTDATSFEQPHQHKRADADSFAHAVENAGRTPGKEFSMSVQAPPDEVADRLGITDDQLSCLRMVTQHVDGDVWSRQTSYYPLDLAHECGLTSTNDIPEGTVARMANRGHTETARLDETTTRYPLPDEAHELGIRDGIPILVWTRTAATDARVTRVTVTLMPGDRNELVHRQGSAEGLEVITTTRQGGDQQ